MNEFELKFKEKTGQNFNDYYKQYKPKLTWYLTKYTKNLEMADEFANMAFVQGLEKIDTYNSELSQFITWITTIAINIVIKDYKDRKKYEIRSLDDELKDNFTLNSVLSYDDHLDDKIIDQENIAKTNIIKNVIESLPDKYKKVMIMRELDKMPYKEIANNIFKEQDITISLNNYELNTNEYFHSATISNQGNSDVKINYENEGYTITINPNEKKEIKKCDINENEKIYIISKNSISYLNIKETTNLSTIKSQIKKGRYLIRKKVKKDFDLIEKNGIK
jgi:RNA polymerase sigma-70 factor (ECF subfamily)